jgi:imidazolonepropionase-like amidohydrolase
MTAVRMLARGFEVPIIISHGEYTSIRIADVLAATGIPMNIGPRHYELEEGAITGVAVTLWRAGVPVSLCTDAPVIPQEELFLQGTMAARLGMDGEAVIRGLTLVPARAVLADARIGSLVAGKDADLVVTRGDLLDPRSQVLMVLVDGKEVR